MAAQPTPHGVTHLYRATVAWHGSTGLGYDEYDRRHVVACPPAASELHLASDPAFRGDPDLLNPEQLLLAAAASCQLLAFLAVAARARIDVVSYEDAANAVMDEDDAPTRITTIVLSPVITVRRVDGSPTTERVRHLVDVAHRECYIANSLKSEMRIEAEIRWAADR